MKTAKSKVGSRALLMRKKRAEWHRLGLTSEGKEFKQVNRRKLPPVKREIKIPKPTELELKWREFTNQIGALTPFQKAQLFEKFMGGS